MISLNSDETVVTALKGSIYFLILAWFSTGINFVTNIILARLLFPEDFGISSISFTIIGIFSMFIGFGLGPGVIQSKREKNTLFSTFFFIELITTTLITLLIFSLGGIFANLFMDIRIKPVIQVLCIYIFLFGINSIPKTYLTKELEFKKITLIESFSVIINLSFSVSLALFGFGFWSLIYGPLMAIIFRSICYWIFAPILPKFSEFNLEILKELLKFAFPILFASIVIFWNTHIDDIVIAQVLGLTFLGLYSLSFKLSNYITTLISHPISRAMYPIYCKIQDDNTELKLNFENNYRMILTITVFITFYMLINAKFIISFIFGEKWLLSIPILQILIFEGFLRSLASISGNVFQALNKYYWVVITSIIYFFLMTPLMIIATINFGIIGTALIVTITYTPIFFISYLLLRKYVKYNIIKDTIIRFLSVGVTIPPMLLIIYFFSDYTFLVLILNLAIALAIYSLIVNYLTKGEFVREIKEIFNIFLKRQSSF